MLESAVKVFISYSHKDEALRDSLATHLSNLQWQGIISSWYDRQLVAGMEWDDKIKTELESADIILLLISPDFIASKYCRDVEIPMALQRHEARQAYVVPIILRPFDWFDAPFSKLQAFPKDAKPVTTWANQDEAFVSVTQGIRTAAKLMLDYRRQEAEQKQLVRAQYLQKVEEVLSDGVISIVERDTLDELRETLGLTSEEAKEIETHAYEPFSRYEESLNKYQQTLNRLIDRGYYPFSEEIEKDLENRQRDLGLKPEDAARVAKHILDQAESAYLKKQIAAAADIELRQRQEQERAEYDNKLRRYEQEFTKAIQVEYPMNQFVLDGLKSFQQQLGLRDEDIARVEQLIRQPIEAKYQEKLKRQEQAEQQRKRELEERRKVEQEKLRQEAERQQQEQGKAEYENKLRRYEQEFTRAIQAGYPMNQFVVDGLKSFQQQFGLKDKDVARIEQEKINHQIKIHIERGETFFEAAYTNKSPDDYQNAISEFRKAIQLNQNNALAHYKLGEVLSYPGDGNLSFSKKDALCEFRKAVELEPNNEEFLFELKISLECQDPNDLRKELQSKPNDVDLRLALGASLSSERKYEEALIEYRRVIELHPNCIEARYRIAGTLMDLGMLNEAIFEYRQIIEILISEENKTDSTVWSLFTIGNVFGNQGELDEAVALYREAIQIFQHLENQVNSGEANNYQLNLPANIHKNLGIALCKQGKFEEGIFEFEMASKLSNKTRYQEGCSIRIKQAKEGNTLSKVKFENL